MNGSKILVTGATGFIGKQLTNFLASRGFNLTVVVRKETLFFSKEISQFVVDDLSESIDWHDLLIDIDVIIHLAGKAHVIDSNDKKYIREYKKINTDATFSLANQAAKAGVRRFIYMSSARVNGKISCQPLHESDPPHPVGAYASSKYEAELSLINLAKETTLEVVILRPPLVYGPNAIGNFGLLTRWANNKILLPLPLDRVRNSRSMIGLTNLIEFIILCIDHPRAANEIFLISDCDLSTTKLLRKIATAFGKKAILFPVPLGLMIFVLKLLGKENVTSSLFSSFVIDSSKARNLLGWKPLVTMDELLVMTRDQMKK